MNSQIAYLPTFIKWIDAANIDTEEASTTGNAYIDLTTVGPSVTLTTGTTALIWFSALGRSTGQSQPLYLSVAISGATTINPSDTFGCRNILYNIRDAPISLYFCGKITGLTAGDNTFKLMYKVDMSGETIHFRNRSIAVFTL
jgi:hypothetical protein